jgi:hypothetical protein
MDSTIAPPGVSLGPIDLTVPDTELQIQIRKKVFPGKVVKKQFYTKNYKK